MLSRRMFLASTAALAVTHALPTMPAAAPAVVDIAVKSDMLAFAVGTPGEYDWQHIVAKTAEDAFKIWHQEHGSYDDEDDDEAEQIVFDPECVMRIPEWDGLKTTTPADWLRVNMGYCCDRCGYETSSDQGAIIAGDKVVCEECTTFADRLINDEDDAYDELLNLVADQGEEAAKNILIRKKDWDDVPADLWARAVVEGSHADS